MSDLAQTIVAIATLVTALGAAAIGWRNSRKADAAKEKATAAAAAALTAKEAAESSQRAIIETKDGVFEVGKAIDGRLSELLAITKTAALAEGRRLEGVERDAKTNGGTDGTA